jgi:hypothetical protein
MATIGLLQDKGIRPVFTFGFNWHWRGETKEQWLERRHCQFKGLRKELRDLHNDFPWRLLEMVPVRFLITGAACGRHGVRRRLPSAKLLRLDYLEFDLDFRPDGLRRIILHLPHPVAGFYTDQDTQNRVPQEAT